ncbi:hypothetical protein BUALT_Bualt14G0055300 [Buddleja alternifolia]|uniref:Late embryogenesis abundant protein LEA-2 subgroup domain-containing protein n=1 Tax=Buddleja alternifolia TaxID=168488 RepID=A0AAV6WGV5_9LAMI|nr:hypothetical protein BUALT_Bualt14G0055300 [Buddleja alternifolia]
MGRINVQDRIRARAHPLYLVLVCCCLTPFVILGLLIYIFTNIDPSCSIQNFYVPAINKLFINSSSSIASDSIVFFDLELENYDYKSVHYGAVNLTFSYGANSSMPIGEYTMVGFNQGKGKKAYRRDVAVVTGDAPWEAAAMTAVSSGSTAVFKVHLDTELDFRNLFWYSNKKRFAVGGMVKVDDTGKKVEKKPILLRSGASFDGPPKLGFVVVTSLLVFFIF